MTKILVVAKETSYREFTRVRDPRVLKLLKQKDPTVVPLVRAHDDHEATLVEVKSALKERKLRDVVITKDPSVAKNGFDLVITVGGDGTLLRTSHHVGSDTPILAINSAPDHSVGFFCAATKGEVRKTLKKVLAGEMPRTVLSRMRVTKGEDIIENRVLNEILFCHENPAATSRYILRLSDGKPKEENQRSSGVWVGPAAGSTAAQRSAGGRVLPLQSRKLQFVVREPYRPHGEPLVLPKGLVPEHGRLTIVNKMQNARIFVDGFQRMYPCAMGEVLDMCVSDEPLIVLGMRRR